MQTTRAYPDQTKLSNTIIFHRGDKRKNTGDYILTYHVTTLMHTERIAPNNTTSTAELFLYEYCITRFGSTQSWMKEGKAGLFRRICEFIFDANSLLSTSDAIGSAKPIIAIIDDSIMGILDGIEDTYITSDTPIDTVNDIFERALRRSASNTKQPTKVK